ncbi:MAG: universal stress protein [Cyclobacteriaceae bacterium]|nr:universal stress protein [Cyclobacteriaceae bacterium]
MESYEIKRILVPVDFSPASVNALQTAVAMAKRQLATITLLHVIENTHVLVPPETRPEASGMLAQLMVKANEQLGLLAKVLRFQHDLVVNHVVQVGNAADETCRWALHKGISLIVMGTHGSSGLRQTYLGSSAYRVVKNAPCPVMTIPGTNEWLDFKKVLFPIRLVPQALDKYDVLRPILRKNGSSLMLAGIVKRNDTSGFEDMKKLVNRVARQMAEDQVLCVSDVYRGDNVAQKVVEITNQVRPDLIVITATLDPMLGDFFLGPYTQDIINHAHFPVLSVRPDHSWEQDSFLKHALRGVTIAQEDYA